MQIEIAVSWHPARNGNRTLKERKVGEVMWSDIMEPKLFTNDDSASFYRALAQRMANHSAQGITITSYEDTTH